MKSKYMWLCALLIFSMCFGLCACDAGIAQEETSSGCVPSFQIDTYEKYLEFVETGKVSSEPFSMEYDETLPDDFVLYEDISAMGSFEALIMTCAYDFSEYVYSLNDPYVGKFLLYIDHEPDELPSYPQILNVNRDDLRMVEKTETCIFRQGDLRYSYVQGKLSSVKWTANNIEYCVFSRYFEDSPLDADTAISKLLKAETAEAVAAAIVEKVEKS